MALPLSPFQCPEGYCMQDMMTTSVKSGTFCEEISSAAWLDTRTVSAVLVLVTMP